MGGEGEAVVVDEAALAGVGQGAHGGWILIGRPGSIDGLGLHGQRS